MPRAPPCFLTPPLAPRHQAVPSLCKALISSKSFNSCPICLPSLPADLGLQTSAPTQMTDRTLVSNPVVFYFYPPFSRTTVSSLNSGLPTSPTETWTSVLGFNHPLPASLIPNSLCSWLFLSTIILGPNLKNILGFSC